MPEDLRVFCNSCKRETRHSIQRNFEQVFNDGQIEHCQVIQCAGCDEVSFLKIHIINIELAPPIITNQVFPPRTLQIYKQFDGMPEKLDRIYKEMIDTFNSKSFILCAGGLRALVEGICAERHIYEGPKRNQETGEYLINQKNQQLIRGRNLACKIEGLAESHLLTEPQARALHQHRYLGNSALHELEIPSAEMLIIAISIIENVMESLYNIPVQAGNLGRLRENNV